MTRITTASGAAEKIAKIQKKAAKPKRGNQMVHIEMPDLMYEFYSQVAHYTNRNIQDYCIQAMAAGLLLHIEQYARIMSMKPEFRQLEEILQDYATRATITATTTGMEALKDKVAAHVMESTLKKKK